MHRIGEVEDIDTDSQAKLVGLGISTTDDFLARAATPGGRSELAGALGVTDREILKWANCADLMRVDGIGKEFADLLEEAGVDTVPELAQRSPNNLHARVVEVNTERQLSGRAPTAQEVEGWIAQARELPRVVQYGGGSTPATASTDATSANTISADSTSANTISADTTSADMTSADMTSANTLSADSTSTDSMSADSTSADTAGETIAMPTAEAPPATPIADSSSGTSSADTSISSSERAREAASAAADTARSAASSAADTARAAASAAADTTGSAARASAGMASSAASSGGSFLQRLMNRLRGRG